MAGRPDLHVTLRPRPEKSPRRPFPFLFPFKLLVAVGRRHTHIAVHTKLITGAAAPQDDVNQDVTVVVLSKIVLPSYLNAIEIAG